MKFLKILFFLFAFLFYGCGIFSPLKRTKTITKEIIKTDTLITVIPEKKVTRDSIEVEKFLRLQDTIKIESERFKVSVFIDTLNNKNKYVKAEVKEKPFLYPVKIDKTVINKKIETVKEKNKINNVLSVLVFFFALFGFLKIITRR